MHEMIIFLKQKTGQQLYYLFNWAALFTWPQLGVCPCLLAPLLATPVAQSSRLIGLCDRKCSGAMEPKAGRTKFPENNTVIFV